MDVGPHDLQREDPGFYDRRLELAREVLSSEPAEPPTAQDESGAFVAFAPGEPALISGRPTRIELPFPNGLAPQPQGPEWLPRTSSPLPRADVLVVTWTADEADALAAVLTPGYRRDWWIRYDRFFAERYAWRIRWGAPAAQRQRLGVWLLTRIGKLSVLAFKSELHMNQDGVTDMQGPGLASLPVRDLLTQMIDEVQPSYVITTGTAGGLFGEHDLGDVAVSRAARFRLRKEFRNAPFNGVTYKSDWTVPTAHFETATGFMATYAAQLAERGLPAPTTRHTGVGYTGPAWSPRIRQEGHNGIPEFHPILTTDFFEYGTSQPAKPRKSWEPLWELGLAVEMGDAVLGLVCAGMEHPPRWAAVRNLSDPQINGDLPSTLGDSYAVYYYEEWGFWTSVMSAITTWAIVAGLPEQA